MFGESGRFKYKSKQAKAANRFLLANKCHELTNPLCRRVRQKTGGGSLNMRKFEIYRGEIKFYVVCAGMEGGDDLSNKYRWSCGVPELSGKLGHSSLRYEMVALVNYPVRRKREM